MTTVSERPRAGRAPKDHQKRDRRWWIALIIVVVASFTVLLQQGMAINRDKPPIPSSVTSPSGQLMSGADIVKGQQIWQSMGGQEIGSVWGHGAYVAPDWTADWLHREAMFILDTWAKERGVASFDQLKPEDQGALQARLKSTLRTNTYDKATGVITLAPVRVQAYENNVAHYTQMFRDGHEHYAIPKDAMKDPALARQMCNFFWWTAWAASTNAPNNEVTYTQNWPHEPLIDNVPPADNILWSIISFILLLAGIAGMVYYHSSQDDEEVPEDVPSRDPLLGFKSTPSQQATLKYFFVVGLLFVLQIAFGIIGAHYGVEGGALFGIPIDQILPYAVVRTWHTQLGILWIATAWLATGLYVAPAVGGKEPKFQRLGVNVLFGALLVVVLGSMAGEWLSIMGKMGYGNKLNFWFGTQGMEYVDLGRAFQIGLIIGLFLWFALMWRGMAPALKRARSTDGRTIDPTDSAPLASGSQRSLIIMLLMSCLAIAGFYGAAFGVNHSTHLSIAEYWRWWVVHLWVEGFFEVFATAVMAFLFSRLRLVKAATAQSAVLASTVIFLSGGILGTFHHLYFTGAPSSVLALGAAFSALEVVPLALMGFEAFKHLKLLKVREWVAGYKWAIYFFVSVSFWNMLGAGIFGFLINPPISLFYVQGLNLTPLHGHTALFGVYGMLGIGLMLFCVRSLMPGREWNDKPIAFGFWCLNGGLFLMAFLSLLPLGLAQAWASIQHGLWYARSDEFLYTPALTVIRWLRIPGDIIFGIGALAIGVFMVGLLTGHSLKKDRGDVVEAGELTADDTDVDLPTKPVA
ncbi:nitric oxide reductase large subunit [Enemella dayhoffiae]|uniref:Nitric oxide reductase large subunit n=1 Tax=Enemella dayhoffiae TaxID=2016507 RepID=A0A255H792_9ACTN|nr:nitric-oxide reductase large subunit [Enemella dayhoffiae]OYO23451.1 nitric oxide reductase large subunit [Enemella dayhoffiae]